MAGMTEMTPFWRQAQASKMTVGGAAAAVGEDGILASQRPLLSTPSQISRLESILSSHPPVLESLLAQLPTNSILGLYHTSSFLRQFLQHYPLAWRALSFRLPQAAVNLASPGMDVENSRERQSKQHALDSLLMQVVMPAATRLRSLDLDNTAIGGMALMSTVVQPRIHTLEHLSVRGCKNVSIKYHIVPFLQMHAPQLHPWAPKLALKSLYTYRCRHHRRRPYLPSSLVRRDSDSEPTHELIEICHQLGIWTDTAWCPTPGGRCYRRKDYHGNRAAPGTQEVWVPFDRLWRSGNRIGPVDERPVRANDGRLWEDYETGHEGEALGTENSLGDGKYLPAHLRSSHTTFVDNIKCDQCGDAILERCETCSIKMHCMGCRKTLCASCSFNRPIPRKRTKIRHFPSLLGSVHTSVTASTPASTPPLQATVHSHISLSSTPRYSSERDTNRFWWAPGAHRSPNLMSELPPDSDSEDEDTPTIGGFGSHAVGTAAAPLKLNMHWCCIEPIFSGGGGVAFLGPGQMGGSGSDRIRAVPLPKKPEYMDPDFQHTLIDPSSLHHLKNVRLYEEIMGENVDILPYLMSDSLELQARSCPRSLCGDCWRGFRWRVSCRGCNRALCKEHDFRGLKVRKCGYRDLGTERDYVRNPPPNLSLPKRDGRFDLVPIPAFRRAKAGVAGTDYGSGASTPVPVEIDEETTIPMARIASTASSNADSMHLMPAPTSTSTGLESALQQLDVAASASTLNMELQHPRSIAGPSGSRQRSVSLSGLADRSDANSSPLKPDWHKRYLLPGHPGHPVQWQGCGAYFCQRTHPAGDGRVNCSAELMSCRECGVLVCEYCLLDQPSCPCTVCSTTFHCPVCVTKPAIRAQCTREEEQRAMELARERERERAKRAEEDRMLADGTAEAVGEFWAMTSAA